jgi:hypothetical protein
MRYNGFQLGRRWDNWGKVSFELPFPTPPSMRVLRPAGMTFRTAVVGDPSPGAVEGGQEASDCSQSPCNWFYMFVR